MHLLSNYQKEEVFQQGEIVRKYKNFNRNILSEQNWECV